MSIETKNYIATASDIRALASTIVGATAEVITGRTTYLRALVATTQAELHAAPRKNATAKPKHLKGAEIEAQLKALLAVHDRFYVAVLEACEEGLPAKDKALELNRRSNFARTALYAVRSYIRAGNDITYVVAGRTTKITLAVTRTPRRASARSLKSRMEARSKALMVTAIELSDVDKATAVAEIELLLGQLAAQLAALGVSSTKDAAQSAATGAPLSIRGRVFVPVTATQVIRQRANPS